MKSLNFNILQKSILIFCISLFAISCSTDSVEEQPDNTLKSIEKQKKLADNSKNIAALINSFDVTLKEFIMNPKLSNEDLSKLFIQESKNNGLRIVDVNQDDSNRPVFSREYLSILNKLQIANHYNTKDEYSKSLLELKNEVLRSTMSIEEQQLLVDSISFLTEFIDWAEAINDSKLGNFSLVNKKDCDGWWSCWGACVAGTIGGAIAGGITGCGVGGAVGAGVGAAIAAVPSAGIASPIGAGVGGVVGCVAVGAVGAIGGALTGAAASCD